MPRTVSVDIKMRNADFRTGAGEVVADTKAMDAGFDELGQTSKERIADVETSLGGFRDESEKTKRKVKDDTGEESKTITDFSRLMSASMNDNKTALQSVQEEYFRTAGKVKDLRAEFAKSGSSGTFGDLKNAEGDLKKLSGYVEDMGGNSKILSEGLGGAEAAGTGLLPIVAGLAAFFAPLLGGVAAGSVLALLGGGGLAAGVAGQLSSPQVQGALGAFEANIGRAFHDATSAFAPATANALDIVAAGTGRLLEGLKPAFTALAPYLDQFASGLAAAEQTLLPGLSAGLKAAGPVIGAIASELPLFAHAIGIFFQEMANGSQGAGEGLKILIDIVSVALVAIGGIIDALSHSLDFVLYVVGGVVNAAISVEKAVGITDPVLRQLHNTINGLRDTNNGMKTSTDDLTTAYGQQAQQVDTLAAAYLSLNTQFTTYSNLAQKTDNTNLAMHKSLLAFHSELKDGAKYWDINTKAGQANVSLLDQVNQKITDYYDTLRINGQLTPAQTKAELAELIAQRDLAQKYGATGDELSTLNGEIGILNAQLLGLPKTKTVQVHVHTTFTSDGSSVSSGMGQFGSRHTQARPSASGMGQFGSRRWGGAYEHAAVGLLNDASIYGASSPGRYMIAEPQTGGEAFVPKRGDYGRSMSILHQAAGWYGASVVPGRGGPSGPVNLTVQLVDSSGRVTRQVLIQDALNRGVPQSTAKAAYP